MYILVCVCVRMSARACVCVCEHWCVAFSECANGLYKLLKQVSESQMVQLTSSLPHRPADGATARLVPRLSLSQLTHFLMSFLLCVCMFDQVNNQC